MRNTHDGGSAVPKITYVAPASVANLSAPELRELLFQVEKVERQNAALKLRITQRSAELHRQGCPERPEDLLARSGNTSKREIRDNIKTARVLTELPEIADRLDDISPSKLTTAVATLSKLEDDELQQLDMERIAEAAATEDVASFAPGLRRHITDKAVGLVEQQKRAKAANEVKHWFDKDLNRGRAFLDFDPITYEKFAKKIDVGVSRTAAAHRRRKTGETLHKDAHLAAEVFCDMFFGASSQTACGDSSNGHERQLTPNTEMLIVVDAGTVANGPHPGTTCETENGTELPHETMNRHLCNSVYRRVVVEDGSKPIDVGRRHRTATDRQWAALKGIYSSCAFDDCDARIGWCEPHHIKYWRNSGQTDLDNLVPLCNKHHHLVHEGGWSLELEPDRALRIFDDKLNLRSTTDPPTRSRAPDDSG